MPGLLDYRVPVYLLTGILVIALLKFAEAIFVPLTLSLFAIALVWPLQAALQRYMPKLLALLVTLAATLVVILAVGSAVVWGFGKLVQWLFANAAVLQATYTEWVLWLEEHGFAIAGPLAERYNVGWLIGMTQATIGRLNGVVGYGVLIVIFVMLGLLEVDDFNQRLRVPAAQPFGQGLLRANRDIGAKLRRYMVVRSLASVLTGLVVWAFALYAGLELAAAWGAIAFALNYIPFLGPLIATVFPTLFAVVQFDGWHMAIVVFVVLNVIQFVIGSYFEPLVTGKSLSISPFAVIFAVFFGSFLWGLSGAFIGVPILIAFVVYCAQQPSSRWLAALLSHNANDLIDEQDQADQEEQAT